MLTVSCNTDDRFNCSMNQGNDVHAGFNVVGGGGQSYIMTS